MTEIVQSVDPIRESLDHLLVVLFPKTKRANHPLAVGAAQGAEKYHEMNVDGQTVHISAFGKSADQADRCILLLNMLSGASSVQIFAKGRILQGVWGIHDLSRVLSCYQRSTRCRDVVAHCHKVIPGPNERHFIRIAIQRERPAASVIVKHVFPCALLAEQFRFQPGHPAKTEDLIQAEAVKSNCDWCPNFNPDAYKIEKFIETENGLIRFDAETPESR